MALVHARRDAIPGDIYAVIRFLGELLPFRSRRSGPSNDERHDGCRGTLTVALKQHSLTSLQSTLSSRVSQWRSLLRRQACFSGVTEDARPSAQRRAYGGVRMGPAFGFFSAAEHNLCNAPLTPMR